MGTKAAEALDVSFDELPNYLHAKHSVYMEIGSETYYLTDVNDRYWRAQDTAKLNEKGHYVDASELVPTVSEFMTLPFVDGKSIGGCVRGSNLLRLGENRIEKTRTPRKRPSSVWGRDKGTGIMSRSRAFCSPAPQRGT